MEIPVNFAEKIKAIQAPVSKSTQHNVGYLYLQKLYQQLDIASFFRKVKADSKITFDPDLVNRFMTCSRDPDYIDEATGPP